MFDHRLRGRARRGPVAMQEQGVAPAVREWLGDRQRVFCAHAARLRARVIGGTAIGFSGQRRSLPPIVGSSTVAMRRAANDCLNPARALAEIKKLILERRS